MSTVWKLHLVFGSVKATVGADASHGCRHRTVARLCGHEMSPFSPFVVKAFHFEEDFSFQKMPFVLGVPSDWFRSMTKGHLAGCV